MFNAVLNEPISDIASYTTDRSPVLSSLRDAAISLADHAFQTADFGRFTGGLQYEEGPLTLQTITVPGNKTRCLLFSLEARGDALRIGR